MSDNKIYIVWATQVTRKPVVVSVYAKNKDDAKRQALALDNWSGGGYDGSLDTVSVVNLKPDKG